MSVTARPCSNGLMFDDTTLSGKAPTLMIPALCDPDGANLDRIQVIKGWTTQAGEPKEQIYDVAWSGERKPGPDGKLPPVGDTVNVEEATYTNSIGAPYLDAFWVDPDFEPAERAFYYVRVIEISTPRWTAYDAKFFDIEMPEGTAMEVTDRGYTSPTWYTPKGTSPAQTQRASSNGRRMTPRALLRVPLRQALVPGRPSFVLSSLKRR